MGNPTQPVAADLDRIDDDARELGRQALAASE
jgi:hypothetical protein